MRLGKIIAALCVLLLATATSPEADACGPYGPPRVISGTIDSVDPAAAYLVQARCGERSYEFFADPKGRFLIREYSAPRCVVTVVARERHAPDRAVTVSLAVPSRGVRIEVPGHDAAA